MRVTRYGSEWLYSSANVTRDYKFTVLLNSYCFWHSVSFNYCGSVT